MMELRPEDLNRVLLRIPRDVREFVKGERLIIAGGFIRAVIAGESVRDLDLFGESKAHLEVVARALADKRNARFHETDNAFTILTPGRMAIQFIHRWVYPDGGASVISDFDYTIAQAAIWAEPVPVIEGQEAKHTWHSDCSDRYYADLAAKRLVYTSPSREEEAGGSLLRARKFLARGYHIGIVDLAKVMARVYAKIRFDPGQERNEAWLAQIVTGMLREVDPLRVVDGVELEEDSRDD